MTTSPEAAPKPQLVRGIGLGSATALNMIDMIGVGPFITIPLIISAMGGPQAMLGWVLGAVLAICDGLVWAELGAAMPGSGGSYRYLLSENVGLSGTIPFTGTPYTISRTLGRQHPFGCNCRETTRIMIWIPAIRPIGYRPHPLNPGDTFHAGCVRARHARRGYATGIVAAYLNATYDSSLVSVTARLTTVRSSLGPISPSLDRAARARRVRSSKPEPPTASAPASQPRGRRLALQHSHGGEQHVGLATFTPTPATQPGHDVIEYLSVNNQPIPTSAISFVPTQINIGSNVFVFTGATPASPNVSHTKATRRHQGGTTPFVFNVTWFLPDNRPTATVQYSTSDGTATADDVPGPTDYVPTTGTLTFTAGGPTTLPITITVNGDTTDEPDETFFVNLTQPLTGQPLATTAPAIGTILNDDDARHASASPMPRHRKAAT